MSALFSHQGSCPANLALIKYMGKVDGQKNRATNPSLSITLDALQSLVRLSELQGDVVDQWKPLSGAVDFHLDPKGQQRFLNFFSVLKDQWGIQKSFLIESANNFPSDCGLASSASSFAALTKTSAELFQKIKSRKDFSAEIDLPNLSRLGSGSSCRSFGGPLVLWSGDHTESFAWPWGKIQHAVVVVSSSKKKVSSSEAHRLVANSLLFEGRILRAQTRLEELLDCFQNKNWRESFQIVWEEFMDMHALFETSRPAFGYFNAHTQAVLNVARDFWQENQDGPLVTMDAGPNVHFIFREDQIELKKQLRKRLIQFHFLDSGEMTPFVMEKLK